MIGKIANFNQARELIFCASFSFGSDALNVRLPIRDPSTNKLTDQYIHHYENPMFRAYMEKRKLHRSQVWPKIHILGQPPASQMVHINTQKTLEIRRLMSEAVMKRIVTDDPSQINTVFIVSLFSEDNFKELIDQYLSKVLVCGKAPSEKTASQMKQLEEKTIELFKMYYFGEKISPLQRQIQMNYLASKQVKFSLMQQNKKNALYKCNWRDQDQRIIEDYINWPQTNINLSDLSFRPFYERLSITSRLPYAKKLHQLIQGNSWTSNWNFRRIKQNYEYSIPYLNWIRTKLFSRVIQYTKCLQFTHTLKIPADFTIDILVTNIHIWLITNRLKKLNTKRSLNLANMLENTLKNYVNQLIGGLHMRRQAGTIRKFNQFINIATNALNKHFNVHENTKNNPYLHIDALVWSIAMKEKTQRYSEQVYLFSEYLVKNWELMNRYSEEDIMDGVCQFDCFLMDPDYKQKIMTINPPLPTQQFQAEFESNKQNKKFYYQSQVNKQSYAQELVNLFAKNSKQQKYSFWSQLGNKIVHFVKKYMTTLQIYDQISEMENQKAMSKKKDKSSPWKTETDRIVDVEKQFDEIEKVKKDRRKGDTNQNNSK